MNFSTMYDISYIRLTYDISYIRLTYDISYIGWNRRIFFSAGRVTSGACRVSRIHPNHVKVTSLDRKSRILSMRRIFSCLSGKQRT
jgi:hypothetical protein